jgi:hypothetical protein
VPAVCPADPVARPDGDGLADTFAGEASGDVGELGVTVGVGVAVAVGTGTGDVPCRSRIRS